MDVEGQKVGDLSNSVQPTEQNAARVFILYIH